MKILHVNKTYFPETVGGIEESIRTLCNNKAHQYKVFCATQNKGKYLASTEYEGVEVIRVSSFSRSKALPLNFTGFFKFRKLAKWADVVHVHFPWPNADLFSLFLPKGTKIVVTYHSDIERNKFLLAFYKPLMWLFFKRVSKIVATSPNYRDSSATLQAYKDKVEIIPLGLNDYSAEQPSKDIQDNVSEAIKKPFFLFLGVPRKYKGVEYLIRASKQLNSTHTIVVAGDGGMAKKYITFAEENGFDNLVFLGHVSDDEKKTLLNQCVALILPSILRSEAFGLTLVEGAMFGKPLICTEIGSGMSYINQHQQTGLVISPSNSTELAEAMNYYIDNPEAAVDHGIAARKRYKELFEASMMLQSYDQLYSSVIEI